MAQNPTERSVNDRIVWIDCEMTGLSLQNDALIEVAALVTDFELNQLGDGVDLVIAPPAEALEQMDDFVRGMHTTSGLLDDLEKGVTLEDAQEQVLAYIREWVPEPRSAPLGGNTVGTDRSFLARDMPELEAHLHYRIIDVVLHQGARRAGGTPAPTSTPPRSRAGTAPWPTSASPSPSCATTARRCSCPRPGRTATAPAGWPRGTSSSPDPDPSATPGYAGWPGVVMSTPSEQVA